MSSDEDYEDECEDYVSDNESEIEEENFYDKMKTFYNEIINFCKYKSPNDILCKCSYVELANFINNGTFELPAYMFEEPKNLICKPPKITLNNNKSEWTLLRNKKQQRKYEKEQKIKRMEDKKIYKEERKKIKKLKKQKEQELWEENNKYNWTIIR